MHVARKPRPAIEVLHYVSSDIDEGIALVLVLLFRTYPRRLLRAV